MRKLISRGANFGASFVLGAPCSDLTGSFRWEFSAYWILKLYRVYRKPVLERVIKEVVSKGYAFQMEIVMRAKSYGYKIEEVSKVIIIC